MLSSQPLSHKNLGVWVSETDAHAAMSGQELLTSGSGDGDWAHVQGRTLGGASDGGLDSARRAVIPQAYSSGV